MPNWTQNYVQVVFRDADEFDSFIQMAKNNFGNNEDRTEFSFLSYIRPYPLVDGGAYLGRDIMHSRYGCKWLDTSFDLVGVDVDELSAEVTFCTPWSPPEELYEYMEEQDMFEFFHAVGIERGMDFGYKYTSGFGAETVDLEDLVNPDNIEVREDDDYNEDEEHFWEQMDFELDRAISEWSGVEWCYGHGG